jgi:hypothetical protein
VVGVVREWWWDLRPTVSDRFYSTRLDPSISIHPPRTCNAPAPRTRTSLAAFFSMAAAFFEFTLLGGMVVCVSCARMVRLLCLMLLVEQMSISRTRGSLPVADEREKAAKKAPARPCRRWGWTR